MLKRHQQKKRQWQRIPRSRPGFTLIELLVVVVILGILVGLLVPAVMRAVGTAKEAACAAEIRSMGQALAAFKSRYGTYPPSRIVINEMGNYSAKSLGAGAPLAQRSMTYLRRFFPRIQLSTTGAASGIPGGFYDVNGNGKPDVLDTTTGEGAYILTGPECLVLFLGGVPQASGSGWSTTGFSKNPLNPFQNAGVTTNRTVPDFEFNNSRLVNNPNNGTTQKLGGFPGYIDSMGTSGDPSVTPFYCYFSAYEGTGYDPADADFTEPDPAGIVPAPILGAFTAKNSVGSDVYQGDVIKSPSPNPYTTDIPVFVAADGTILDNSTPATMTPKTPAWLNAQSFQIISAGQDRLFGIGGQYLANANDRLPFVIGASGGYGTIEAMETNAKATGQALGAATRTIEKDNITNFSPGKLE